MRQTMDSLTVLSIKNALAMHISAILTSTPFQPFSANKSAITTKMSAQNTLKLNLIFCQYCLKVHKLAF